MVRSLPNVMAKNESRHLVTPRDLEILAALDRTPLTALQLLKLSGTFEQSFGSERMVRERLQALCAAGWARSAYYATAMQGAAPKYFFLTAVGYALVHGHQVETPSRRSSACPLLAVTRHRHSRGSLRISPSSFLRGGATRPTFASKTIIRKTSCD